MVQRYVGAQGFGGRVIHGMEKTGLEGKNKGIGTIHSLPFFHTHVSKF
jgi:hypothetical protein